MKHVKGALDVVVKDDDAVATVGQDEGAVAGVDDRKSDAAATENVKSAAAGWWLMAAWLLRCREEEKRRARVKLWLLWDGKGAVGEWRVCGGGQYGLNGGRAVGASMERGLLHHGRGAIERRCRGIVGAALVRRVYCK